MKTPLEAAPGATIGPSADTGVPAAYTFETLPDFRVRVLGGTTDYLIDPHPRGWSCTCAAFHFAPSQQKSCKHIIALRAHLAARAQESLADTIAEETQAVLERCEPMLDRLETKFAPAVKAERLDTEAQAALMGGHRIRAWWLRARAAAVRRAP